MRARTSSRGALALGSVQPLLLTDDSDPLRTPWSVDGPGALQMLLRILHRPPSLPCSSTITPPHLGGHNRPTAEVAVSTAVRGVNEYSLRLECLRLARPGLVEPRLLPCGCVGHAHDTLVVVLRHFVLGGEGHPNSACCVPRCDGIQSPKRVSFRTLHAVEAGSHVKNARKRRCVQRRC